MQCKDVRNVLQKANYFDQSKKFDQLNYLCPDISDILFSFKPHSYRQSTEVALNKRGAWNYNFVMNSYYMGGWIIEPTLDWGKSYSG